MPNASTTCTLVATIRAWPNGKVAPVSETTERPRIDFRQLMIELRKGEARLDDFEPDVVAHFERLMKAPKEKLQAQFDAEVARERNSPRPGSAAPDFKLELLDEAGKRTGKLRRLSDYYNKPVALIFGSFT